MTTAVKGIVAPTYSFADISTAVGLKVTATATDYTPASSWTYGPSGSLPVNLAPLTAIAPVSFTVRGQDAAASALNNGGNINISPGVGTGGNASGNLSLQDSSGLGATWNTSHLVMGAYHFWIDSSNMLRWKAGVPSSAIDGQVVGSYVTGSATYDPPSLVDGAGVTTTVGAAGAALGDMVTGVSFSLDLQGITVTAYVSAANVVSVRFQNESTGTIDLASGTLKVRVAK